MDDTFAEEWFRNVGDDEDEPVFEVYEIPDDVWSIAAKEERGEIERPVDMFDAELSLRLANDPGAVGTFWEENRDRFPKLSDVGIRIDFTAATELEERLWSEAARRREEMLQRIESAPRHSGFREDEELLRDLVHTIPAVLSYRRKQVFELCIERGFSVRQCAEALGIGKETVRTHLRRLRARAPAAWCVQ